jgi:hypothetical protein
MTRPRKPASGRTTLGGWGNEHRKLRLKIKPLVDAGAMKCARCNERILPGQPWALDHSDARGSHQRGEYLGPSHAGCNVAAGQALKHRRQTPAPALAFFRSKSLPPNPSNHPEVSSGPSSPEWPIPLQRLPSPLDTI